MDVVVIFNGLGNQMSQYAYYLAKKKVNPNTKVIFDIMSKHNHYGYDLERAFGIEVNKTLLIKVLQIIYVLSRNLDYSRVLVFEQSMNLSIMTTRRY